MRVSERGLFRGRFFGFVIIKDKHEQRIKIRAFRSAIDCVVNHALLFFLWGRCWRVS
ncbi:hypothetical protein QJS10_CPA07g01090 [Acorus calamus]|uniref:Uncharacterized protein n=1 Tax=Acorus calamus TaxID=4465 RepID=A0AAV9EFI8_ACOCL|nr:hypothetical protein QJS10_CPA07g01090 [Acorus calamus]